MDNSGDPVGSGEGQGAPASAHTGVRGGAPSGAVLCGALGMIGGHVRTVRVAAGSADAAAVAPAVEILRTGGIVAYPTDTLYGLAVDPRNDDAVARLFAVKGRDARVALPLIASDLEQARAVGSFGALETRLAERFWPGPLTIVVPARAALSAQLLAGGPTVAIRVPDHRLARALAAAFRHSITATSANVTGQPPASRADEIGQAVLGKLDLVLDGGPSPGGPPSTIVEIVAGLPRLRRAGAIVWDRVLESLQ